MAWQTNAGPGYRSRQRIKTGQFTTKDTKVTK